MDAVLFRLYAVTFLFSLMMGIGLPLVPQHMQETFGASLALIGFVTGAYGIMQIVLRLPMGDMADRKGRKPSLYATFGLSAVGGLFYVFAPSALWILPGHLFFGLASGIFWVAANSYLFDRVPPDEIAKATSHYSLALGLAFLVGPPLGGAVADRYGFPAALSAFVWASLAALALVATLPEIKPAPRPPSTTSVYARAWRIFRHPDILVSAFGTLMFGLLVGVLGSFFPVYIRGLAYTALVVGIILTVREITALVVRLGAPRMIHRVGPRRTLLAGVAVTAAAAALTPEAITLPRLALLSLIAGVGIGVMVPANLTLVHRGAPPKERGLANGIYGTALGLGTATVAWVFGPVGDAYGIAWTFRGAAGLALLGTLVIWFATRHHTGGARAVPAVVEDPAPPKP